MALQFGLIAHDIHIPYQDKTAYGLFKKVYKDRLPTYLIANGDWADNYHISSHPKKPSVALTWHQEMTALRKELAWFDTTSPKTKKVYIEGNHENRLERYLMDKAPELFEDVTFYDVAQLEKHNWEHIEYRDWYKLGKVYFTHDVGKAGKFAHYDARAAFEASVFIGHTHFFGYQVDGNVRGERHVSGSFGWMGDYDAIDYKHKAKKMRDWAHGFGAFHLDTKTGYMYIQPVPIVDGTCMVDGKLYRL